MRMLLLDAKWVVMCPRVMRCVTLDGSFVSMSVSDTRATNPLFGCCMVRFSVTCFFRVEPTYKRVPKKKTLYRRR